MALLLLAGLASPQTQTPRPPATPRQAPPVESEKPESNLPPESAAKMLKLQHDEVKKEVDKLVKLVTEVQEEVEKAGENVLPLSTLKKLDEVVKQARKVRTRLKQ